ncbi:MAG: universal stress protein [Deltaproteobacteria bacterium]|nr:universal stress protein [Deltaproteobacteria bacterium]
MNVNVTYNRILVPIDFSDSSRKAFYVALKFARLFDAETRVLHVFEPMDTFDGTDRVEAEAREMARFEDGVKRRVNELFARGGLEEVDRRKVFVDIRGGKPWKEILSYIVENKIDLVVMGNTGNSGLKDLLLGSTTERVVRRAPCHVLCVKTDDYEYEPVPVPSKFKDI